MNGTCAWNGCAEKGTNAILGTFFCKRHEIESLTEQVMEGLPRMRMIQAGGTLDQNWLKFLFRVMEYRGFPADSGLTKGKVSTRGENFHFIDGKLRFSIDRHPVGKVTRQWWEYDIPHNSWEKMSEVVIESDYERTEDGQPICPNCGGAMRESPGRISCYNCSFKDFHEHSL